MDKYEIILYWSDKDGLYIAEVPELPGCTAHGDSREKALQNAEQAIQLWIETAIEFNDPVPEPKGRKLKYA
jgi:predicted RNase H-like HicB family nuclease